MWLSEKSEERVKVPPQKKCDGKKPGKVETENMMVEKKEGRKN